MALETTDFTPPNEKPALRSADNFNRGAQKEIDATPPQEQRIGRNAALDNATMVKFGFPTPLISDTNMGHMNGTLRGDEQDRKLITGPKAKLENHLSNSLNDRVISTVAGNEGGLTTLTKNDAGHGISVGIRQWNQKRGELPDLLKSFHDKNPEKFDATFGRYADRLLNEKYVRKANLAGNKEIMRGMKIALADPEFQEVQVDKFRKFADKSAETAKKYGLKSELGAALVADITNQMGEGGLRRVMRRAGIQPGGEIKDEAAALKAMEKATRRPNSSSRFELLASNFSPDRVKPRTPVNDPRTFMASLDMVTSNVG